MKTKIKILIVSCVIAAATVTGFNLAQNSNNMDVTLADIAMMARADGESGGGNDCNLCVVKNIFGKTIFSCEPMPDENCSSSGGGYSVSCENASSENC